MYDICLNSKYELMPRFGALRLSIKLLIEGAIAKTTSILTIIINIEVVKTCTSFLAVY